MWKLQNNRKALMKPVNGKKSDRLKQNKMFPKLFVATLLIFGAKQQTHLHIWKNNSCLLYLPPSVEKVLPELEEIAVLWRFLALTGLC